MRKIVIVIVVLAAVASCAVSPTMLAAQTYKAEAARSLVLASAGNDPTKTLTLKVPAMPLGSITLTLPNANASGVLLNDGTGSLSWFSLGGMITNPMTSPGDMIYGGLLGVPSRFAATATANQILLSGASAAPSWSTATYPATSGSSGNYLRSDGTNFVSSSIQVADVPTLNQNTTGTAAKLTTPRTIAGTSFDGSANIALANKFIVQGTSDAGLSGAQFLGSLTTGLVKNTTATGVLSIASAGTDYSAGTSALATGILKSTTATGALTIAVAADFPTLNQNTTGTAATATNATNVATTLQTASASTFYPTFVSSNTTSGGQAANVATGLSYVPSTGTLSATTFSGAFSGNAAGFTGSLAGDVTGTQGATAINTTSAAGGHIITALTTNAGTLTNSTSGNAGTATKLQTARTIAGTSFDGSANIALANKFIVQGTTDAGLSGAQFLGSLGTGLVKNTTATGVLSIAVASDFPTLNQNTTGTASNVTGVVALANGGTGVTNASGVAQNAVFAGPSSGGAGAASWRALAAADIPAGSGNYIQNTSSQQATSNFNISGNGTIGGTLTAPTHTGGDGTTGTALTVRGGNGSTGAGAALTLSGGTSAGTAAGAGVTITGSNASTSGAGGAISVTAGNGTGTAQAGGAISMTAGNGGATTSSGGGITLTAGNGGSTSGNGGSITLAPGTATSGTAGAVYVNGKLGAATGSPNTTLDVNGDFATRATSNSTTTTTLNDISSSNTSNIYLTSETGDFTVTGFANGFDGKHLHIYNKTTHTMTIGYHEGSSAGNQINTLCGGNVTLHGSGTADFVYDGTANEWVMQPVMANTIDGLAAVGINYTVVSSQEEFSTSNVTDPYLNFPATAGATYEVRGIIIVKDSNNSNSDAFTLGFSTGSSSSVMEVTMWAATGAVSGNTAIQGASIIEADGSTGQVSVPTYKSSSGAESFYNVTGIIKPAVSGTLSVIWHTTGGGIGAGVIKANSYLAFTRVQ